MKGIDMNKDYLVHWVLGVLCAAVWFWGDKLGVPPAAVTLASTIVPTLLGHAVAYTPDASNAPDPQSTVSATPTATQPTQGV
jgi:hypothetical protein